MIRPVSRFGLLEAFFAMVTLLFVILTALDYDHTLSDAERQARAMLQQDRNTVLAEVHRLSDASRTVIDLLEEGLREGSIDFNRPESVNPLLIPVLRLYPPLTSVNQGDSAGNGYMILQEGDAWKNRIKHANEPGSVEWRIFAESGQETGREVLPDDYDPRQRPWFVSALKKTGISWSAPYVLRTTKDLGITASKKISSTGQVVGVDVKLKDLSAFLARTGNEWKKTRLLITNHAGKILAFNDLPLFSALLSRGEPQLPSLSDPEFALEHAAVSAAGDGELPFETINAPGGLVFAGITDIPLGAGSNFRLIISVPRSVFMEDFQTKLVFTLLVYLLILSIISYFYIQRYIVPLKQLSQRISEFDFSRPSLLPNLKRTDEIGLLYRHMNEMTGKLLEGMTALRSSEAHYRLLVENSGSIILRSDRDDRITYINRFGADFFGETPEKLTGSFYPELTACLDTGSGHSQEELFAGVVAATDGNRSVVKEVCARDGRRVWISWSHAPFRDESGKIVEILSVGNDVTALKHAKDEVARARDYISNIINVIADPVFVKDEKHCYVLVNEALCALLNGTRAEILGKSDLDFFPQQQVDVFWEMDDKVLSNGVGNVNEEEVLDARTGQNIRVITRKSRYVDLHGNRFIVGVVRDVTELRDAEEERMELNRRLLHAQKLESLGVLAGGIAHDFNNLLMVILGNLDLAVEKLPDGSDARRSIRHAVNATRRATELTNRMLAYTGKGSFAVHEVNLSDLVEENAAMFTAAVSKKLTLELQPDCMVPPVKADAVQIQQVIMNLLTNASEAIGDQSGTIRVTTGVQNCDSAYLRNSRAQEKPLPGKYVWLEVSDTGCGMDEGTVQRIFDPFFTTKFTGRGLGMSVVLGIVRGHHGALFVDSVPQKGTVIRVLFPAVESSPPSNGASEVTASGDGRIENVHLSGNVLLADDESMVLDVCKVMLEEIGFTVITAIDGVDAVRVFSSHADKIDLVILDASMPRKGGVEAYMDLHAIRPDVKVILSSGYTEQGIAEQIQDNGLAGFIQKPFTLEKLRQITADVLCRTMPTADSIHGDTP